MWRYGYYHGQNHRIGTLVLDLCDSNEMRLMWRGSAEDNLSQEAERNEDKLDKSVDKMLNNFPPNEQG
jgi:Domain of unknown function (DUF4136)